jgi:hypothetical protein
VTCSTTSGICSTGEAAPCSPRGVPMREGPDDRRRRVWAAARRRSARRAASPRALAQEDH